MDKQKELDGMPEPTELGKKAIEMIALREQVGEINERIEGLRMEMVELFIREQKSSIRVEGHVVAYSHVENDRITVSHDPKGKKSDE